MFFPNDAVRVAASEDESDAAIGEFSPLSWVSSKPSGVPLNRFNGLADNAAQTANTVRGSISQQHLTEVRC
jgi:hypothetical protein